MKVRISYLVDVDDRARRGMRAHYGEAGLATRKEIKAWFQEYGQSEGWDMVIPSEDEDDDFVKIKQEE